MQNFTLKMIQCYFIFGQMSGIYNNKNLDMKFEKNVKGKLLESDLFAEKAEYSNSKSFLEYL